MSEKLQILKDSVDLVFTSKLYREYEIHKQILEADSQFKMYNFILNNKTKFSASVYARAKLKYINKQGGIKKYRLEVDEALNHILGLYDKY